jgi:hypothetical protein
MLVGTEESMELLVDNVSNINLAKHLVAQGRGKHIERKFHLLRDQENTERLELKYCKT